VSRGRRLLFVCSSLGVGGFQRHLAELVRGLRERGYETAVLALRHTGRIFDEMAVEGVDVRFAAMRGRLDVVGLRRAVAQAHGRADAVLTESIDAHLVGRAIARRERVPHVTLEHGGKERLQGLRPHHRLAYRLVAPRVDAAVSVSAGQVPAMIAIGYRPETIAVIRNGVAEPVPMGGLGEVRERLGLEPDAFVAILVATLRPEKRADRFVAALVAANREEPRVRGVVVGSGPELGRVSAAADATGGVVRAVGDRTDVADWIEASDVVALASTAECLPLAVLEAMALFRPVVATDVGDLRELVVPGETGLLVEAAAPDQLAPALVSLAHDRERVEAMGVAAHERFRAEFTLERMIDDYDRLLTGLLD
jgi:glycosyltransferase involved in cell wall biosynthesis